MRPPKERHAWYLMAFSFCLAALLDFSLATAQQEPAFPANPQQVQPGPSSTQPSQPAQATPQPAQPTPPAPQEVIPVPSIPQQVTPWSPNPPRAEQPSSGEQPAAPGGGVSTATQGLPEWLSTPPFREFTPLEVVLPPPVGALEPPRIIRLGPPDQLETPPDFRLETFLTVDEEYTDNVFQTKNNRQSAFQTNVSPGLSFNQERPTTTLNFTYAPTFFFSSNPQQSDQFNQYLTLRGALRPTALLQFNIADDYTQANSALYNPNLGTAYRGTGNYFTNTASATGSYIGSQLRTALSYTNTLTINEQQTYNNSQTQTGLVSAEYTTPRTTLSGSYGLVRGEYPNATVATISPNYWEQDVNASVAHPLTPSISLTGGGLFTWHQTDQGLFQGNNYIFGGGQVGGNINVGPTGLLGVQGGAQVYNPENGSTKLYPSGNISYTQQFSDIAIGASYQQAITANFTDVVPTGPSETRTTSLFLQTTALRNVTARLSGQWIWNRYLQASQFGSEGTTVSTWQVQAQIRYTILRSLNLTLGYILTNRTSNVASNEYLENRGQVALTYTFSSW